MAIREVLTSFTFEQQRQMINLIGTDVGDTSLLLTPTPVVVTAINEVITGDVDLSNQTIGMDDGTLASPSLFWDAGQGFYRVSATKLALTSSLAITGDLEVDGNITFRAGNGSGGTLTFGDLDTDNIVFNADVQSSIVPNTTADYNLGTLNKQWNNLWIDGTASIDTLTVDENATITGNLTITSGNVYVPSTQTVVDLFDDYATTVQAFGAGTSIRIGDVTGTLTLRNPTIVSSQPTISLFNTVATNISAFGAATEIYMGIALGGGVGSNSNFTIRSDDTILLGDLNVNGGEILSSQNTFDLLVNNTDVRIGAVNGVGNTIINNSLSVKENIDVSNSGTVISIKDNTANSLVIREGSNSYMTFTTTDAGERVIVHKDLYIVGNLDVTGTNTVINTTTLSVDDINITLGDTASPTDALANGGGITLRGTSNKTITYVNANAAWTLSEHLDLVSTKEYKINNTSVLTSTTLGSDVVNSSLTSVGTLTSLTVTGAITANGGIRLGDNDVAYFGDDNDLSINHDGSNSYIKDEGTGSLYIQGTTGVYIRNADGSETMAGFTGDGAVELYHDNSKKFETTLTGISITGNIDLSTGSDTTDANTDINASTTSLYHKQVSFTADRTITVSNLTVGKKVQIWIRNTNGSGRNITFAASTTSSGHSNVLIANPSTLSSFSTVNLPPSNGTICVTIFNANGNIVGCVG